MLYVYRKQADGKVRLAENPRAALGEDGVVWIDMLQPTPEEESAVENLLGVDAPTPAERKALEESSRFFEENDALYLTVRMLARRRELEFVADDVSIILAKNILLTVRAFTPRVFEASASGVGGRASVRIETAADGPAALLALLEGIIERLADHLQSASQQADEISNSIFVVGERGPNMRRVLGVLGRLGVLINQAHGALASLQRLGAYATHHCEKYRLPHETLVGFTGDVEQLERTAEALQNTLTFLLDATLGLVGVVQNNRLGVLSVVTIIFLPPTLIASIFGMNFKDLPGLDADWGPPLAFALMAGASLFIYLFGKARRWL